MSHTPGPWTVEKWADKQGDKGVSIRQADSHIHIANVVMQLDDSEPANARLIAAAPDGYAANVLALRILEFTFRDEGPEAAQQAITALRAAIAHAEVKP